MLIVAIIPSLTLLIAGPALFSLVLGSQWSDAGTYARCMSIMVLFQFVNFPLVHTLNILEKQIWQLIWDGFNFILGIGGIYLLNTIGLSDIYAILYYSCLMSIMFIIHYFLSLLAIDKKISWSMKRNHL